jgi:hypothetical protein
MNLQEFLAQKLGEELQEYLANAGVSDFNRITAQLAPHLGY